MYASLGMQLRVVLVQGRVNMDFEHGCSTGDHV